MTRFEWSAETRAARAEANEAIDKMLRLAHKDRLAAGNIESQDEDYPEFTELKEAHLTGWIVAAQYQSFVDPEISAYIHGASESAGTVKIGLATLAAGYWG